MEEGDGTRAEEHFHRNEAISAVTEDGFMVDEEEDDYEDLYNDVNVGDGVFRGAEANGEEEREVVGLGFKNEEEEIEKKDASGGGGDKKDVVVGVDVGVGGSSGGGGARGGMEEGGDLGFGGENEVVRREERERETEGQNRNNNMMIRMGESEGQSRNNNMQIQGLLQQPPPQVVGGGSGGGGYGVGNTAGVGNNAGGGGTTLYVGDLHWWTTDADVENELCKYGQVKEVKFFDEKASGKSKGYCQVEFYDSAAAAACKEGMNGHVFNGKACTVQFGTPFSIRRMGEAQVNRNQAMGPQNLNGPPGRRGVADGGRGGGGSIPAGGNYQGGDGGRGYGRGNWGRGNGQGMGGRGQGPMRNRIGGMGGGRAMMGNGGGNGFGQGMGPNPQMMHPQSMMGQGFDPGYGPNMGRMGGYGGFPVGPTPPFSGMLPSFPPVGGVSMPGVAPHVNPAFFGRGMPGNGMGMMPGNGMDGHGMGMWGDPNAGGWGGEDPGGRVAESSYGEDAASDHQYGEASHDRGGRPNAMKEKDRSSEKEWSGPTKKYRDESERDMPREKDAHDYDWSERKLQYEHELSRERGRDRDHDRERDRDRDRYKEDRDRDRDRYREERGRSADYHKYKDRGPEYDDMDRHRYKDREPVYDDEWERGRSSRAYSKPRSSHEEDHRARSRDVEYSKRRRVPSE